MFRFGCRRDGRGQAGIAATVQPNGFQMTGSGSVQHTIPLGEIVVVAVVLVCLGLSYRLEAMGFGQVSWSISPSLGPAHYAKIPKELSESLRLNVDTDYLDHLAAIANGAGGVIEPSSLRGLIAFPSMHTVMSLLAVTYTVGTRAFPYLLALNIPILPAILLHGGHHLVDSIGGTVVFLVVAWLVRGFCFVTQIASRHA